MSEIITMRPARGSAAYGLRHGLRRLGHGPLLVLRHDLIGQHAEQPLAAKRRGREARDLETRRLLVAIEADLEASLLGGSEGYHFKVWARLRVCRDIRALPSASGVLRLFMRENNLLIAPSLPPPWRQSP